MTEYYKRVAIPGSDPVRFDFVRLTTAAELAAVDPSYVRNVDGYAVPMTRDEINERKAEERDWEVRGKHLTALQLTDLVLTRAQEDMLVAADADASKLPAKMQDALKRKRELRQVLAGARP